MKTTSTQQEILLLKGSRYLCKEWSAKDEQPGQRTEKEQLEEACWNGLIRELLPELFEQYSGGEPVYLWQIREGNSFLELEIGEEPLAVEKAFSLDPELFLAVQALN